MAGGRRQAGRVRSPRRAQARPSSAPTRPAAKPRRGQALRRRRSTAPNASTSPCRRLAGPASPSPSSSAVTGTSSQARQRVPPPSTPKGEKFVACHHRFFNTVRAGNCAQRAFRRRDDRIRQPAGHTPGSSLADRRDARHDGRGPASLRSPRCARRAARLKNAGGGDRSAAAGRAIGSLMRGAGTSGRLAIHGRRRAGAHIQLAHRAAEPAARRAAMQLPAAGRGRRARRTMRTPPSRRSAATSSAPRMC